MIEIREFLGYPMLAARMGDVVELCDAKISEGGMMQIGVINAAKVVNAERDRSLRQAILSCDVVLADGQSIIWASKLLGRPLPERLAGIDLFVKLLELADRRHRSVYLLGGTQEVNQAVVRVVHETYPGARIAGARDGYYNDDEANQVAIEIASCRPDMLFLGMTSPRKETFLERYQPLMRVPVTHGVGGSFDILAGVTHRAPVVWQQLGMEWAYRLVQEPGRMWKRYLRTNILFSLMVLRSFVQRIVASDSRSHSEAAA